MLYYDCPACRMRCETTDAFAGKTVHCPHCGKQVVVPSDAITTAPPPRPRAAPTTITSSNVAAKGQPIPPPTEGESGGGGMRNFILVVVGIIVLAGIGVYMLPGDRTGAGKGKGKGIEPIDDFSPPPAVVKQFSTTGPVVVMETSMGTVKIQLDEENAPISSANFLKYVDAKRFDGTIFHRVIKDFMIQGGGFNPGMEGEKSTFPPIRLEARNGLSNQRGAIAMARTSDPNSATSQFFINTVDNSRKLGPGGVSPDGYAVFGRVIDGMDVVDEIRNVRTHTFKGHENVPVTDVLIKSIRRGEPK
ncbi:MAG TPA: peptidylprolyl isomerase [Gemmataceae bacterium]|nr:peptidylprolyl isomerase [Gemmataceae bacterium]